MRGRRLWPVAVALAACASAVGPVLRWSAPARGPRTSEAAGAARTSSDREIAAQFSAARAEAGDLDVRGAEEPVEAGAGS